MLKNLGDDSFVPGVNGIPQNVPSLTWRECIKKIWKQDPLICPECQFKMKILSFIDNPVIIKKILKYLNKSWVQFSSVKLFADGIPLTYTSWMNEDYISGDAGHGISVVPGETDEKQREHLISMIKLANQHGYQVGVHATGDRAIDASVDGFIEAIDETPGGDPRHYVIHGDFISPDKIKVLAANNLGISMQPTIKAQICDFEPTVVGEERSAYEWPTKTVLDHGVNLTFSSDAPVTYPNWRQGIQDAVLREGLVSGKVSGPDQRITVKDAIKAYTINGAWQDRMEHIKGSVENGKAADLCVIGEDILNVDHHEIGKIPVLMTMVDGRIVFDSGAIG